MPLILSLLWPKLVSHTTSCVSELIRMGVLGNDVDPLDLSCDSNLKEIFLAGKLSWNLGPIEVEADLKFYLGLPWFFIVTQTCIIFYFFCVYICNCCFTADVYRCYTFEVILIKLRTSDTRFIVVNYTCKDYMICSNYKYDQATIIWRICVYLSHFFRFLWIVCFTSHSSTSNRFF